MIDLRQFESVIGGLETHQLVYLLGFNMLSAEKYPKWPGREDRREALCRALVRRGVNPYYLTVEEFRRVFGYNSNDHGGLEQMERACRNLAMRAGPRRRDYAEVQD